MQIHAQDPQIMAEVERQLSRRTREIRLKGPVHRLFLERTWSQTSKIIRSWMTWVAVLNVLTLALNAAMVPYTVALSMLLPGAIVPPVAAAVVLVWQKPRARWLQGLSLILGMFLILLSVALVGASAGGDFYDRALNIMLFVAITAIIIFSVPLSWTATIAAMTLGLYFFFQVRNPGAGIWNAVDGALFFASGFIATVVARRTMTILAQKAFLLELRDKKRVAELAEANDRLERLTRTDPLTGIGNRRWMSEILERLWKERQARPSSAAMLMCDIDDFKPLNDYLGHADGDRCLIEVAGIIRGSLTGDHDEVARYGGEEFLVLLPDTTEAGAVAVADRIRRRVEAARLPNPQSRVSDHVTLSIGVAVASPDAGDVSPEALQRRADAALYQAKQEGRNRVVLHAPGIAAFPTAFGKAGAPPKATPLQ